MESAGILRSFHGVILPNQEPQFFSEKPVVALKTTSRGLLGRQGLISSSARQKGRIIKASEKTSALTSDSAAGLEKTAQGPVENRSVQKSTFPNGFEALVLNVCDETSIAELKLKVGSFEMHLKRDIGNTIAQISGAPGIESPTTAPPIPSEPMTESAPSIQPVVPQKSASTSSSPFANILSSKASKLASLEASGAKSYVLVSSPTVGTFRRGRTLKGKKQPPSCKEGDMIKEGQVIGYLDQFGNELPIKSDAAGEVLKLLFKDGEAVGYGDPLVAVLPSFHAIK
ncbi:uncharacterized protein A4U43_UnF10840 [Asparagus officinalis]|uniref:Lipoyl-binding domain-containing protein n=1 Tax=Asparagus officinalis TaxID=4686 RepID=A0A1R3L5F5_ASPOF|nr:uncharacterized protein LOC109828170 [Asparagus officinalis]ONK54835.1 uncharacterized protein A4U43_UnF10840 [Asparagus officinalis]